MFTAVLTNTLSDSSYYLPDFIPFAGEAPCFLSTEKRSFLGPHWHILLNMFGSRKRLAFVQLLMLSDHALPLDRSLLKDVYFQVQWFSNTSVCQNHLSPTSMLLVWGPHMESQCSSPWNFGESYGILCVWGSFIKLYPYDLCSFLCVCYTSPLPTQQKVT